MDALVHGPKEGRPVSRRTTGSDRETLQGRPVDGGNFSGGGKATYLDGKEGTNTGNARKAQWGRRDGKRSRFERETPERLKR